MSRVNVKGEKFDLAFGVDHATGGFVQLWIKPTLEQDGALVKIDSFGVYINKEQESYLHNNVLEYLKKKEAIFNEWKKTCVELPEIGPRLVIEFALCVGGFPDISRDVYQIFCDDI